MVNDGLTKVDFVQQGDRGKCLVEYTPEDLEHFETLIEGFPSTTGGTEFVTGKGARYIHRAVGMETLIEDNMFGDEESRKGVIGMLARKYGCNAYEIGNKCLINVEHGQISTRALKFYLVGRR